MEEGARGMRQLGVKHIKLNGANNGYRRFAQEEDFNNSKALERERVKKDIEEQLIEMEQGQ